MAAKEKGGKRKSNKDKERAAAMKRAGLERTTGRCALCYKIITIMSRKSRYTHICRS